MMLFFRADAHIEAVFGMVIISLFESKFGVQPPEPRSRYVDMKIAVLNDKVGALALEVVHTLVGLINITLGYLHDSPSTALWPLGTSIRDLIQASCDMIID